MDGFDVQKQDHSDCQVIIIYVYICRDIPTADCETGLDSGPQKQK